MHTRERDSTLFSLKGHNLVFCGTEEIGTEVSVALQEQISFVYTGFCIYGSSILIISIIKPLPSVEAFQVFSYSAPKFERKCADVNSKC